jgi:hypothetical protein
MMRNNSLAPAATAGWLGDLGAPTLVGNYQLIGVATLLVSAALVRIAFWSYTDWTIEDGMIVGRIARNFARSGVLSFNTGEVVSSATSPLFALMAGVLVKAGLDPISAVRVLGLLAGIATAYIFYASACAYLPQRFALLTSLSYTLLPTTVAYNLCGLETPLYTLACMAALFTSMRRRHRTALLYGALALVFRPDGLVVLGVVLAVAMFEAVGYRQRVLWAMPAALVLCINFGVHYAAFGEIIPHTMIAKSGAYHIHVVNNVARYLWQMLFSQPAGLALYALASAGLPVAIRVNKRTGLLIIWYVLYHLAFMLRAPLFDWYLQPPTFVVVFFAGFAIWKVVVFLTSRPILHGNRWAPLLWPTCLLGLILLAGFAANVRYMGGKLINREYERNVREAAGRWLNQNAKADDLVFTESLGYIGYYNNNPLVDWPGLVSADIPGLIKGLDRMEAYERIIDVKKPEYLVLRNAEWGQLSEKFSPSYEIVGAFPSTEPSSSGYLIAKLH